MTWRRILLLLLLSAGVAFADLVIRTLIATDWNVRLTLDVVGVVLSAPFHILPDGVAGLLGLLLLLAPLSVIYALRKARRMELRRRQGGRSVAATVARMLVLPTIVLVCAVMAGIEYGWIERTRGAFVATASGAAETPFSFYTGLPPVDLFVWLALSFGNLLLILFFATIPYLLGSLLAALLLALGWRGPNEAAAPEDTGERPL